MKDFSGNRICDYPVGFITGFAKDVDPNTYYPDTTWEQIKDRFLLASGSQYSLGQTGGESMHVLNERELPEIRAWFVKHGEENGTDIYGLGGHATGTDFPGKYKVSNTVNGAHSYKTPGIKFGGNAAHNNMPPYEVVNYWKRTA